MNLLKYSEVVSALGKGRSHLLLGNGFSIACMPLFSYGSLFDYAKANGLSPSVLAVFDRLGTNNFEGVMHLLEDGHWLATHYGLSPAESVEQIRSDLESVKSSLINAIAKTHPTHTGIIDDSKKRVCANFLEPYHNVFTTNYDLLLYWVEMAALQLLEGQDGFRQADNGFNDKYVVFSEHLRDRKGVFFLHGALHLYVAQGQVRKHSWTRSDKPLIESIREGLNANQYPLFVAEGSAEKKLEQIQRSSYLSYCLGKLDRIQNTLVVYGLSFGDSDSHIRDIIASNKDLKTLFIGLYGDHNIESNLEIRKNIAKLQAMRKRLVDTGRIKTELQVQYYSAESAPVWQSVAT